MARIQGVEREQAGLLVRFMYWMTKRKVGRVVTPVKILAHHPGLLRAQAAMEMGQMGARSAPSALKALVQIKVAMLIGCPF